MCVGASRQRYRVFVSEEAYFFITQHNLVKYLCSARPLCFDTDINLYALEPWNTSIGNRIKTENCAGLRRFCSRKDVIVVDVSATCQIITLTRRMLLLEHVSDRKHSVSSVIIRPHHSDVCRRQILTSKVGPRTVRVTIIMIATDP